MNLIFPPSLVGKADLPPPGMCLTQNILDMNNVNQWDFYHTLQAMNLITCYRTSLYKEGGKFLMTLMTLNSTCKSNLHSEWTNIVQIGPKYHWLSYVYTHFVAVVLQLMYWFFINWTHWIAGHGSSQHQFQLWKLCRHFDWNALFVLRAWDAHNCKPPQGWLKHLAGVGINYKVETTTNMHVYISLKIL